MIKVGFIWIFNLLYVYYFGGVWECFIGFCCCILDVFLLENRFKDLIFDVFSIFMSEVSVIMNICLLLFIFSDLEDLLVFFLFMILMQKECDFILLMNIIGFGFKDVMKSQWKLV